MSVPGLGNVWQLLKAVDNDVSNLRNSYTESKKSAQARQLPGRRTMFLTATEFIWPRVALANTAVPGVYEMTLPFSMESISQPVIMGGDGIYVLERISYEAYIQFEFDNLASTLNPIPAGLNKPRTRRDSLSNIQNGLASPSVEAVGLARRSVPVFDFENLHSCINLHYIPI